MDAPQPIELPEPEYAGEADEGIRAQANIQPDIERESEVSK